jgi:hypothetical protein
MKDYEQLTLLDPNQASQQLIETTLLALGFPLPQMETLLSKKHAVPRTKTE